jgi:hypothetical protein
MPSDIRDQIAGGGVHKQEGDKEEEKVEKCVDDYKTEIRSHLLSLSY